MTVYTDRRCPIDLAKNPEKYGIEKPGQTFPVEKAWTLITTIRESDPDWHYELVRHDERMAIAIFDEDKIFMGWL